MVILKDRKNQETDMANDRLGTWSGPCLASGDTAGGTHCMLSRRGG